MKKFLIVTADDFGLHEAVNEAVERASRAGVLTCASLMVAEAAAPDAVRRAAGLPDLRVGLHVVLADGRAMLDARCVPDLVDPDGRMGEDMFLRGVRYFALPRVRGQLEAEIRAQFAAFARTGLRLDHVNVHKHFHLHPSLLAILLRVGVEYGVRAVRLPREPLWFAARNGGAPAAVQAALLRPWLTLMKRRLAKSGIFHNDQMFGIAASGGMDEATLLSVLARLPSGVTEIYLHPAVALPCAIVPSMQAYRHADELAACLSPRVKAAIAAGGMRLGGFEEAARA